MLAKFKLGLFDQVFVDERAAKEAMFTDEHRNTALEMARQSIVLLSNQDLLPLKKGIKLFVTGPNANNHSILGDWALEQPQENISTVVDGLRRVAEGSDTVIDYLDIGDQVRKITSEQISEAARRAGKADVALVVVGENPLRYDRAGKTSGENVARSSIDLFGRQLELVQAVHAAGKPTIVALVNGRPLSEPWIVENSAALIEAWEPGALGGQALAEIIFGIVNPSGKLPITIPYSAGHIQAIYNHKPSARRHKYADAPTRNLFEFGYGLSYADYHYGDPALAAPVISASDSTRVTITVSNTSERAGDEIVQLYIRDEYSQVTRPVKELKEFRRIHLEPGQSKDLSFDIRPEMLAYYNLDMQWVVEKGSFQIMLGPSSKDSDLKKVKLVVN